VTETYPNSRIQQFGEPQPTIADLRESVAALGLGGGTAKSLEAKLRAAEDALARGQENAARNNLAALASQLEAQSGKSIDAEAAAALVALTEQVSTDLACA
jgi:hypothetical protein